MPLGKAVSTTSFKSNIGAQLKSLGRKEDGVEVIARVTRAMTVKTGVSKSDDPTKSGKPWHLMSGSIEIVGFPPGSQLAPAAGTMENHVVSCKISNGQGDTCELRPGSSIYVSMIKHGEQTCATPFVGCYISTSLSPSYATYLSDSFQNGVHYKKGDILVRDNGSKLVSWKFTPPTIISESTPDYVYQDQFLDSFDVSCVEYDPSIVVYGKDNKVKQHRLVFPDGEFFATDKGLLDKVPEFERDSITKIIYPSYFDFDPSTFEETYKDQNEVEHTNTVLAGCIGITTIEKVPIEVTKEDLFGDEDEDDNGGEGSSSNNEDVTLPTETKAYTVYYGFKSRVVNSILLPVQLWGRFNKAIMASIVGRFAIKYPASTRNYMLEVLSMQLAEKQADIPDNIANIPMVKEVKKFDNHMVSSNLYMQVDMPSTVADAGTLVPLEIMQNVIDNIPHVPFPSDTQLPFALNEISALPLNTCKKRERQMFLNKFYKFFAIAEDGFKYTDMATLEQNIPKMLVYAVQRESMRPQPEDDESKAKRKRVDDTETTSTTSSSKAKKQKKIGKVSVSK